MYRIRKLSSRPFASEYPAREPMRAPGPAQTVPFGLSHRPRVLLADGHRIVAEGVARLIEDAFDVVETVSDGDALFDAGRSLPLDIIVADIEMPHRSGLKALRDLRAIECRVPFVFLTMRSELAIFAAAIRAGANGYVLKASESRHLRTALEGVLCGNPCMPLSLAAQLSATSRPAGVTVRQHSVLRLIAKGRVTKQIARDLGLSPRTVEAHRYALMQALRVHSVIELVRTATALGLLAVADVEIGDF